MPPPRIGQEVFQFGAKAERQTSLDELGASMNWPVAEQVLAPLYPAGYGKRWGIATKRPRARPAQSEPIER